MRLLSRDVVGDTIIPSGIQLNGGTKKDEFSSLGSDLEAVQVFAEDVLLIRDLHRLRRGSPRSL